MFDVQAKDSKIAITSLKMRTYTTGSLRAEVWTKSGTMIGYEKDSTAWTKILDQTLGFSAWELKQLPDFASPVEIAAGERQAFYVTLAAGNVLYAMGSSYSTISGEDSNLKIFEGTSNQYPFGSKGGPTIWNGEITYVIVPTSLEPTKVPTSSPTNAPTPDNWDIEAHNTTVDFSEDSENEMITEYKIGKGRSYEYDLKAGSCQNPNSITNLEKGVDYNVTDSTAPWGDGYEILELKHSFSKDKIYNSSMWNKEDNKIELCETIQLTLPDENGGAMVITEVITNISLAFDLSEDFSVNDITLDTATI